MVALADLDRGAAERLAADHGIERVHASGEALIADPELDCVGVLVPVGAHPDLAIAALEGGKHVFVEKPLALSLAECDRIVAAQERSGAIAVVGHNLRVHRLVRRARELIAGGAIGEPQAIRAVTVGDGIAQGPSVLSAWKTDSAAGGGALMEKGVHHYDLWRVLSGAEATEVSAVATVEGAVDVRAIVSATLSNGAVANSLLGYGVTPANEVTVYGEEGRIELDLYAFDGLHVRGRGEISGSPRTRIAGAYASARALRYGVVELFRGGSYVRTYGEEWRRFLASARGEAAVECSLADGREAVLIATAAARAVREGSTIELANVDRPGVAEDVAAAR